MTTVSDDLWGAKTISREIGTTPAVVYRLAGKPDVPINRPCGSGKLWASRSELQRWLRKKPKPDEE